MERQAQLMKKLQAWLFTATADPLLRIFRTVYTVYSPCPCMYVYSMSDGDILHVDIHDTRGGLRIDDCLPFCIIASCFGVRRT